MCPNRQLLSVYYDKEMTSPWKEKMEEHIRGCDKCARQLEAYDKISIKQSIEEEQIKTAMENTWQKINQQVPVYTRRHIPYQGFWRNRISLPIPAVAAIFLVIFSFSFIWFFGLINTNDNPGTTIAFETDFDNIPANEIENTGIIPASILENDLIQYYQNTRENQVIIILQVPENRNFINFSEPAIIRAADWRKP